jgi:hypothetical protein
MKKELMKWRLKEKYKGEMKQRVGSWKKDKQDWQTLCQYTPQKERQDPN